ncbi:DeoR family transcriptional regulator, partial [Candidatus Woesebacteria bacterium]|nr:DeoR family transcriptional regulator [Candidatus Woesebacteria bacterium]
MEGISTRQTQILKAIIEEYIETAIPIGSETIEKKYNLGVSPATIRNDMVSLTEQGFLQKP